MRKFILLTGIVLIGLYLAACSKAPEVQQIGTPSPTETKSVSLNGTWTADGFVAEIGDNSIEISIVGPDSKSLYWKGTFPAGSDKIVSEADTEALASSLLGSQDPTKTFVVANDNEITFEMSMMGTTSTIHLKR